MLAIETRLCSQDKLGPALALMNVNDGLHNPPCLNIRMSISTRNELAERKKSNYVPFVQHLPLLFLHVLSVFGSEMEIRMAPGVVVASSPHDWPIEASESRLSPMLLHSHRLRYEATLCM